jgi:hypothetical protein
LGQSARGGKLGQSPSELGVGTVCPVRDAGTVSQGVGSQDKLPGVGGKDRLVEGSGVRIKQ